jgi:tRNA(Ile)-lysidine synthase
LKDALERIFQLAPITGLVLAYSGGLDSHVLLHLVAQFKVRHPTIPVRAIHIHHQIQAISAEWVEHCQQQCQVLNIPLIIKTLNLALDSGESVEALAREARYQAFSQVLQSNEALLTAHHQDDQAETLLLNLLRGSGVEGLAAMPEIRPLGQGYLIRPLLQYSRAELEQYASTYPLDYINDPSNSDTRFNRNLLRHQVFPLLEQRWPAAKVLLARAAQYQQEAVALNQQLLDSYLPQVLGSKPSTLSVRALLKYSTLIQKALIRHWLKIQGFTVPEAKRLDSILSHVLRAKEEASPLVQWSGCEVRRYRDDLYALKSLSTLCTELRWDGLSPIVFNEYLVMPVMVEKYLASKANLTFIIRSRRGGERFWHGKQRLDLKTYWQTKGVPPWERERRPLIYLDSELILVPDVEFASSFT